MFAGRDPIRRQPAFNLGEAPGSNSPVRFSDNGPPPRLKSLRLRDDIDTLDDTPSPDRPKFGNLFTFFHAHAPIASPPVCLIGTESARVLDGTTTAPLFGAKPTR